MIYKYEIYVIYIITPFHSYVNLLAYQSLLNRSFYNCRPAILHAIGMYFRCLITNHIPEDVVGPLSVEITHVTPDNNTPA
jgi:hypothetical protein